MTPLIIFVKGGSRGTRSHAGGRRERAKRDKREHIMAAARELFAERGVSGVAWSRAPGVTAVGRTALPAGDAPGRLTACTTRHGGPGRTPPGRSAVPAVGAAPA